MEDKQLAEIANDIFNVSNAGNYAPAFRAYRDEVLETLSSFDQALISQIKKLRSSSQRVVRDFSSEKTAQYLLGVVSEGWGDERLSQRKNALCGELCVMEPLASVASYLEAPLGSGDFWIAVLHFEAPEEVPPFTTNYLSCEDDLRNKFIVHSCIDFALPARQIKTPIIEYSVAHMDRLDEICWVVREHQNMDVNLVREVLELPSRSLSSGLL